MNKQIGILLLLLTALIGQAAASTNLTVNTSVNSAVPDGNPVGLTSTATVSGMVGAITNIQVSLNVSGGFNGDLYAYLKSPQGSNIVLLNRVGMGSGNIVGYTNSGFDITLESGQANIHDYQTGSYGPNGSGQATGFWSPDLRTIDPQSLPSAFDVAPTGLGFGSLNGLDPNGLWTLFIADLSGGGQSTLVSWGLTVVTVPEPQTWVLLAGGLAAFGISRWRRR
jgi:subtilisin-like proprotein convertase family protein